MNGLSGERHPKFLKIEDAFDNKNVVIKEKTHPASEMHFYKD